MHHGVKSSSASSWPTLSKFCFLSSWRLAVVLVAFLSASQGAGYKLFEDTFDRWSSQYRMFTESDMVTARKSAHDMFTFGYDNYMKYAFPLDELDPINCVGRGPDYANPSNININDVLGDYSLTLVDALDTLAVMQNRSEFHRAVNLVIENVSFDKDITVQVFEATIRVLGSLLSAHLILTDPHRLLGDFRMDGYNDELLTMAHDLASRLLPAFENTRTGLPHPRVNLMYGVPWNTVNETCTAGAGSLLLEFGVLSRLLGDPTFEGLARRTNQRLWSLRDKDTGLLGTVVNIQTGEWQGLSSGLGAGVDSFYEYLLKAYILFGDESDYRMFNESYSLIWEHLRRGRAHCNMGVGDPPLYVNVHMRDGTTANTWIDALQASFAGVQILNGDLDEAICQHALYYTIWKKYGAIPERFNWHLKAPDVTFYPLRPEFAESTYLLYLGTRNPFYLHVGREIIESLNEHTRVSCGYATVHDVHDKTLEDRMESFFLSETCKYLFLLFDPNNPVNKHYDRLLFTTEGHLLPIDTRFREWPSFAEPKKAPLPPPPSLSIVRKRPRPTASASTLHLRSPAEPRNMTMDSGPKCQHYSHDRRYSPPIEEHYMRQLYELVGYDHGNV